MTLVSRRSWPKKRKRMANRRTIAKFKCMHRKRLIYWRRAATKYKLSVLQNALRCNKLRGSSLLRQAKISLTATPDLLFSCLIVLHLKLHVDCVKFIYNCVDKAIFGIKTPKSEWNVRWRGVSNSNGAIFLLGPQPSWCLMNCLTFQLESIFEKWKKIFNE